MLMTKVPPEIFRFRQTHKLLTGIEERIGQFETGALHDNAGAVRASFLDLAAQLAKKAGRPDIAADFERESEEIIAKAQATPTYRKGGGNRFRKRMRGKPTEGPENPKAPDTEE